MEYCVGLFTGGVSLFAKLRLGPAVSMHHARKLNRGHAACALRRTRNAAMRRFWFSVEKSACPECVIGNSGTWDVYWTRSSRLLPSSRGKTLHKMFGAVDLWIHPAERDI